MGKKDDICKCIADEAAKINFENLKNSGCVEKNTIFPRTVKPPKR